MKRKYIISEQQLETIVLSINEIVAGYDDHDMMYHHGYKNVGNLIKLLNELVHLLKNIGNFIAISFDVDTEEIDRLFELTIKTVNLIVSNNEQRFNETTDKRTVIEGLRLNNKLKRFIEQLIVLYHSDTDLFNNEERLDNLSRFTQSLFKPIKSYTEALIRSEETLKDWLSKNSDEID
jgi:hypothetical protein